MPTYLEYIGWEDLVTLERECVAAGVDGGVLLQVVLSMRSDPGLSNFQSRRLDVALARAATFVELSLEDASVVRLLPLSPIGATVDERIFISSIRAQEVVFRILADSLSSVVVTDAPKDDLALVAVLETVCQGLHLARALMSLLGGMDRQSFLEFRSSSVGASAVDSPGHAALLQAGRLVAERRRSGPESKAVELAFGNCNHAYAQWSALHRALTRHFLGALPGTGGSAGLPYLESRSALALFDGPDGSA